MVYCAGKRLLAFLEALKDETTWTIANSTTGTASRWELAGATWQGEVVVDSPRWIGLKFEARHPQTGRQADYAIDTDLYNFAEGKEHAFAIEIEDEIMEFLENLKNGEVLSRSQGSEFVLIAPRDGGHVRIVAGRFSTTTTNLKERLERADHFTRVL